MEPLLYSIVEAVSSALSCDAGEYSCRLSPETLLSITAC